MNCRMAAGWTGRKGSDCNETGQPGNGTAGQEAWLFQNTEGIYAPITPRLLCTDNPTSYRGKESKMLSHSLMHPLRATLVTQCAAQQAERSQQEAQAWKEQELIVHHKINYK